ncbi:MAG: glycosyltransferase 87 family protein [Ignavibacteria bacterium]|nr:glycosyltransferase 87 family protein [Ignavibacteria bacterium]
MPIRQLLLIGFIMEGGYLALYVTEDHSSDMALFIGIQAASYLLLFLLLKQFGMNTPAAGSRDQPIPHRTMLFVILGFALLFRLTLIPHMPVASDDIYRYVWDGRVAAAGINPFLYAPEDSALEALRTETLPADLNFPVMRTIYPPAAQVIFYASNVLFGPSIAGLKGFFVAADLLTLALLVLLLSRAAPDGKAPLPMVMVYAWSPVPVMYLALEGHVDALGIPFMLLFLLLALSGRHVRSAIALGAAALAKLYPLFLVPFLLQVRARLWILLIPVVMLVTGYLFYYEETGGIFESFLVYNARFEFNGAFFSLFKYLGLPGSVVRILCGSLFLGWIGWLLWVRRPLHETLLLAFLGFLLCSPMAHPWYFTWLAALVAVRWSAAVFLLIGLTNLSNLVVYRYIMAGEWIEYPLLIVLEYVPFAVLFAYEIAQRRILRPAAGALS